MSIFQNNNNSSENMMNVLIRKIDKLQQHMNKLEKKIDKIEDNLKKSLFNLEEKVYNTYKLINKISKSDYHLTGSEMNNKMNFIYNKISSDFSNAFENIYLQILEINDLIKSIEKKQ